MAGVFLSYRREDTQGWVGRLASGLQESFPQVQVFYDIAAIGPGENFPAAIRRALSSCQAMLVLIGPRWLKAQTVDGRRRIDDPADFVRLEIATVLARPILVVPVLFGGAAMPVEASLPEVLQPLAYRQGYEITDKRWEYDCELLFRALEQVLGARSPRGRGKRSAAAAESISVGRGLTVTGSHVGDIVGVKLSDGAGMVSPGRIDVARDARIESARVGDVAGVKTGKTKRKKIRKDQG